MITNSSDASFLNEQYLRRHFLDLIHTSYQREIVTSTRFLSEAEQTILLDLMSKEEYGVSLLLNGGHEYAQRKIASFSPRGVRYQQVPDSPFCSLCIRPKNDKFAESLTHRDVLGTILGTMIDRSLVGDILFLDDATILVFVMKSVADELIRTIDRIRHTVSVRGMGRFRFDSIDGSSKKGRMIITLSLFDSVLKL